MAVPVYYTMLGVPTGATQEQIDRAFERLVAEVHTAAHRGDRLAARRYQALVEAYQVLGTPARRATYDAHLASHPVSARISTSERLVEQAAAADLARGQRAGSAAERRKTLQWVRATCRTVGRTRPLAYAVAVAGILLFSPVGGARPGPIRERALGAPSASAGYVAFALPGAVQAAPNALGTPPVDPLRRRGAPVSPGPHTGLSMDPRRVLSAALYSGSGTQNPPRLLQKQALPTAHAAGRSPRVVLGSRAGEGRYPGERSAPRSHDLLIGLKTQTHREQPSNIATERQAKSATHSAATPPQPTRGLFRSLRRRFRRNSVPTGHWGAGVPHRM